MDEVQSKRPSKLRSIVRNSLLIGVTAVALFAGYAKYSFWQREQDQIEQFGTVEHPKYLIREPVTKPQGLIAIENNNPVNIIEASEKERVHQRYEQRLTELDANIAELKSILGDESPDSLPQRYELFLKYKTREDIDTRAGINRLADQEVIIRQSSKYIQSLLNNLDIGEVVLRRDNKEFTKEVFESLTQRPFPEQINFVHEEQREGVAGYHRFLENKVSVEGLNTVKEALTLLHEYGHVVAQHQEQVFFNPFTGENKEELVFEMRSLEEACAYAFVDAGICEIYKTQPKFASILKGLFDCDRVLQANEYFKNEKKDEHYLGAVLFLSARDALKDPVKVFNTLATVRESRMSNLPPVVLAAKARMIQENKGFNERVESYQERMSQKVQEYNNLLGQVLEVGPRLKTEYVSYHSDKMQNDPQYRQAYQKRMNQIREALDREFSKD